jgi:hypothetical protein
VLSVEERDSTHRRRIVARVRVGCGNNVLLERVEGIDVTCELSIHGVNPLPFFIAGGNG